MWKGHLWEKKTLNILIDEKKILAFKKLSFFLILYTLKFYLARDE